MISETGTMYPSLAEAVSAHRLIVSLSAILIFAFVVDKLFSLFYCNFSFLLLALPPLSAVPPVYSLLGLYTMQTFTLLSVREGQLKDDDNQVVDFANLKVLEEKMADQDGFVGVQVGKFKIASRELATQIITQVRAAGKLPLKIDLDFDFNIKSGEKVELIVKDFKLKSGTKLEA